MDRQQLERKDIPVNARAVGAPIGMNVLYLEDYVHTFIKKLIKKDEEDNGCEVFLYGYEFDDEGKHFLIVSGACEHENRNDVPQKIGAKYFPNGQFLGMASIHSDGVSEMNMEMIRDGVRNMVFKNFYIYYDQNEEMQNYLIEWNLSHRDYKGRDEFENAVKYGRIAQAHNKEEVRVSFLWNVMNILSLGFVVCVMVYSIICVNNYHKMKDMEEKLAYIVSSMTEGGGFLAASAFSPASEEATEEEPEIFRTEILDETAAEAFRETKTETKTEIKTETATEAEQETLSAALPQEPETQPVVTETVNPSAPQYYVVQKGDTLRSISMSVYGSCDRVEEICAQNGIVNPDSILYGQTLLLP